MKLTFLGTAASEGYPNAFCACDNCQQARELGGPSLRKRCSALINDDLLIDFGPDLMAAALQHKLHLAHIRYGLQTHEHSDHLDPSHFSSRSQFCGVYGNPRLHYFASQGALDLIANALGNKAVSLGLTDPVVGEKLNLTAQAIEPFQQFAAGPYHVLSVAATHAPELTAMLYVIEHQGRVIFYGTDTSDLAETTWQALIAYRRDYDRPFNLVVLDHTFGIKGRSGGHLNSKQFVEQVARLRAENLLAADARVFAVHIGHHSNPTHPELVKLAAEQGYEIAYDGLTVEV
jgi:phosphoribosyl 1,2-cyclic phosphate phosphodiesterase